MPRFPFFLVEGLKRAVDHPQSEIVELRSGSV